MHAVSGTGDAPLGSVAPSAERRVGGSLEVVIARGEAVFWSAAAWLGWIWKGSVGRRRAGWKVLASSFRWFEHPETHSLSTSTNVAFVFSSIMNTWYDLWTQYSLLLLLTGERNAKCPGNNLPNVGMAVKTGEVVPVSARRTCDESCSNGLANCGRHRCCRFLKERVAVRASGCQDLLDAVFAEVQMQVAMALADAGRWRGMNFSATSATP
jgi:hypothetical protein